MWFVDVDEPVRNVWDTGMPRHAKIFHLAPGTRLWLDGARGVVWVVVAHISDVVLVRDEAKRRVRDDSVDFGNGLLLREEEGGVEYKIGDGPWVPSVTREELRMFLDGSFAR
jgi:hypothetical protein